MKIIKVENCTECPLSEFVDNTGNIKCCTGKINDIVGNFHEIITKSFIHPECPLESE